MFPIPGTPPRGQHRGSTRPREDSYRDCRDCRDCLELPLLLLSAGVLFARPRRAVLRFTARMLNRTADYQAVQALRAAESRWRALVEASAQIVWTAGANGVPIEDSPSWRAFTGQSLQQSRHSRFEATHPDDQARVSAEWRRCTTARTPMEIEYRPRHVTGEWRWTSARAVPLRSADGSLASCRRAG